MNRIHFGSFKIVVTLRGGLLGEHWIEAKDGHGLAGSGIMQYKLFTLLISCLFSLLIKKGRS